MTVLGNLICPQYILFLSLDILWINLAVISISTTKQFTNNMKEVILSLVNIVHTSIDSVQ